MIQIRKVVEPKFEVIDLEGNSIGFIESEIQFLDLRCQISEQRVSGYIVQNEKGEKVCSISEFGGVVGEYPYPLSDNYLNYLLGLTKTY